MSGRTESAEPRRILHIGKYFPPHRGGMETVLRDQMNIQTRDEGLKVAAVVHSSERRLTDTVEVTELGYRVRRSARWFTAIFAPIAPLFWLSVYREIRELDPDEIKVHMPNLSAFWLLFIPGVTSRNLVILWHADVIVSSHTWRLKLPYWLYRRLERRLLVRAKKIITTSPPYLQSSDPLKPVLAKCVVEPIEIDSARIPDRSKEFRQTPRLKGDGLRILCIGRLAYYKNFDSAVRLLARMPNAKLRIVGEGSEEKAIRKVITQLSLSDRAELLGELDDEELWSQFAWCDVHLLPSIERTEAFGVVCLEAAAFGKPSIVRPVSGSGMPWVVKKCGGLVCEDMSEASMLSALSRLAADRGLYKPVS